MVFEKVNAKVVKVDLRQSGPIIARSGAMLFYQGDVTFAPHDIPGRGGGGGLVASVATRAMGEHERTMLAQGQGQVHYGFKGLEIHCISMAQGGTLTVEMSRLLARTASLQSSVASISNAGNAGSRGLMGSLRGAAQGALSGTGFFTTQLMGQGAAVMLTHGEVLELQVGGPNPIFVDPQSFLGTFGNVQIQLKSALSWRNAVGKGSGEAFQLECTGQGVVFVQSSEEKL